MTHSLLQAETFINLGLFVILITTALAIIRMHRLFAVIMLSGVFSLTTAMLFVTLDAVDVAFTEAAVGAGISTVLMLGTVALTARGKKRRPSFQPGPFLVVLATGAAMIYGTLDMPNFGDSSAPAQTHVAPHYLTASIKEIDVPNVVTSILASYRGFDTMGEVAVVFAAGIGVLSIISGLGFRRRRRSTPQEDA